MFDLVIKRIKNGDHRMEVNSGIEEVPPVNPTLISPTTFTKLINQLEK